MRGKLVVPDNNPNCLKKRNQPKCYEQFLNYEIQTIQKEKKVINFEKNINRTLSVNCKHVRTS